MKKILIAAIAAAGVLGASAQTKAYFIPRFDQNWSIGLDGGVTTPLAHHHAFFGDMRGLVGIHLQKQISTVFALGVEGQFGINTSSWFRERQPIMFDNSYVGVYGSANLMNLFGGYRHRIFDIEITAGAGWGRDDTYSGDNDEGDLAYNYFVTKAGVNFNFNIGRHLTLSLKPSVNWNMTGSKYGQPLDVEQTSAAYSRNNATFNCMVGVTYNFGPGFVEAPGRDEAEIAEINGRINALRSEIDATNAATAATMARIANLNTELQACRDRKPEEVKATNEELSYVLYKFGSARITADQQPYVESIAKYMKENPSARVSVKGYASPEGPAEYNLNLSQSRADSVKNMLVKKYGISADRIEAKGEGVGSIFDKKSWNRVSVCLVEE